MVRDTSILAYNQIKASGRLGDLQWAVYEALFNYGPLSRTETAHRIIGATRDGVHQRFCELRRPGLIKQVAKGKCSITGKTVYLWDVTSKIPTDADFKIIPVWPFSYHVVVAADDDWHYFTGEAAADNALRFCNDHSGKKIMELKGRIIFRRVVKPE